MMTMFDDDAPDAVANSVEEFVAIVEEWLPHCQCVALSDINGVEYALCAIGNGVEVVDTVEDDDYRRESFPDVRSAIAGFMIDGHPLADFLPGIGMYFAKTDRTNPAREVLSN